MQIQGTGGSGYFQNRISGTLKKNSRDLEKILQKLSSAVRINSASDDAAGLAISEQLRNQIRGFKMAGQNTSHAQAALNIASEGTNQITNLLQRQRELALAARNDTLTSVDRQVLDNEYQSLTEEIYRITSSTNFNNQSLLDGTELGSGNAIIQIGNDVSDAISLPSITMSSAADSIKLTSIGNSESASTALDALSDVLNSVNSFQSSLGATLNRLDSVQNTLNLAEINTQAAESVLRDQDMALGLSALTRKQLLNEGAQKAFSRFNEMNKNLVAGLLQ